MIRLARTFSLVVLACASVSAQADESGARPIAGVGLDVIAVDRDLTIARGGSQPDIDISERGSLAGIHAYFEPGHWLRLDGSLQAGSIEYSSSRASADQTESATGAAANATFGVDAEGTRLFVGVGGEGLTTDSPFGDGDRVSWSLYLPLGMARGGPIHGPWRARVRVEARFVVAGGEEVDSVPGLGDVDLDRSGGWGLAASARFHHVAAPVAIEPYLRLVEPADSETETVSDTAVRIEDIEQLAGGVRVAWRF